MANTNKDHLVALGDSGWSLWRWVCLRGAGFAAGGTLSLGSESLAAALEAEAAAVESVRHAWGNAATTLRVAVNAARAAEQDASELKRALNRLLTRRFPQRPVEEAASAGAIETVRAALANQERTRAAADAELAAARARNAEVLHEIAADARFREALTWQNREVVRNTVVPLLRSGARADDATSRYERRAVARYYQRYALKNDTIGFFGPNGWGYVDSDLAGFISRPGTTFLNRREVFFEDWAVAAVAAQLSSDPALREVFSPRRRPSSWLDGPTLHAPPAAPRKLTKAEAWLVARVDGERLVRDVVASAIDDPSSDLTGEDAVLDTLQRLARESVITWGLEIPTEVDRPERWLRARVEKLANPEVRARALEPLDRLEAARAYVSAAAGDPDALDRRVAELEQVFQSVTGLSAKRGHGRTYAGRHIFFEDTLRAVELRVGRVVLDALEAPLGLILHSARWYSYEIARRFRAAFDEIYAGLSVRPVPLTTFLAATRRLYGPDHYQIGPIVREVRDELQRRWGKLLELDRADLSARSLELSADACRGRVSDLFDAPHSGRPGARYHSPDLMIAAGSVEEIERGEFLAVLGEVHVGGNTLLTRLHMSVHPEPEAVDAAFDADMERVCLVAVQSGMNRVMRSPRSSTHRHVEFGAARSWLPRQQVLLAGDLYVEDVAGRLRVRDRAGTVDEDLLAVVDQYIASDSSNKFKIVGKARHVPRIAIGKLVVSRETWHLERADYEDLLTPKTDQPMRRVTAWARQLRLPRCVFATVPHEPKPFYVDFASPIFVDLFVRYLEDATSLGLSEMLPSHDKLWLTDAEGRTYTSELRLAAIDPVPWPAPTES